MAKEKWFVISKKADFQGIGKRFGIDPVIARVINNRGIAGDEQIKSYLYGDISGLHNPHLMKDIDKCAEILKQKIMTGRKIRIIGDYDIDGVQSAYILYQALRRCGGNVETVLPDRMIDGYGLNQNLVENAINEGVDTILTCDNGIAALEAIHLGKEAGLTILVTDHHEIPFVEEDGVICYLASEADAIVNPKQEACGYPFKGLCGAGVAFKLVQVLYELCGISGEEAYTFIENAGFATVGDVMDLVDENRILVKLGLELLQHTGNPGMRALIMQSGLAEVTLKAYHIGFRLGPCLNAGGRLDTAKRSLALLCAEQEEEASRLAAELIALNENRKELTAEAVKKAVRMIEQGDWKDDKVLVVYLPDCHESLAGIVAGRLRERYARPAFVLTDSEDHLKGSGRSIPEYSMYEEMNRCRDLFLKFGGHPMAAGCSLKREQLEALRIKMNELTSLSDEDITPKIHIDVPMPMEYVHQKLVEQLSLLEPFGKGNEKPVFADRDLEVISVRILGKNQNVLRFNLAKNGRYYEGVYFGETEHFFRQVQEKYGKEASEWLRSGRRCEGVFMHFIYCPELNEYQGNVRIQMKISHFC